MDEKAKIVLIFYLLLFFGCSTLFKSPDIRYAEQLCSSDPLVGNITGAKLTIEAKRKKLKNAKLELGLETYTKLSQTLEDYSSEWEILNKELHEACMKYGICLYHNRPHMDACEKQENKMAIEKQRARDFLLKLKGINIRKPLENTILDIKHQIENLRGNYEATYPYPPDSVARKLAYEEIRRKIADLSNRLVQLDDNGLDFRYLVLKHEMACYGYTLAALVEDNKNDRLIYSNNVLELGRKTLGLIDLAEKKATTGKEEDQKVLSYIHKNNMEDRVHYLNAIALSIIAKDKNGIGLIDVKEEWQNVRGFFKTKHPPVEPKLKWALEQLN